MMIRAIIRSFASKTAAGAWLAEGDIRVPGRLELAEYTLAAELRVALLLTEIVGRRRIVVDSIEPGAYPEDGRISQSARDRCAIGNQR